MLNPEFLPFAPIVLLAGQPLRYRVDEPLSVIYSLDRNRRDDGGRFAPDDGEDDLVWRQNL